MKIAFHSYQLGERGTEVALYKYAKYNQEILNNESIIVSTSSRPTPSLGKFKEFETILYPNVWVNDGKNIELRTVLEKICDDHKVDAFYAIKGGERDGIMPTNTKGFAHAIFRMDQPHGDIYAGICKYVSEKHGGIHPYVHHILEKDCPEIEDDMRKELNIPGNALVLGRHGGYDTFNLSFVYQAIATALQHRSDLYFVFLNTKEFIKHERVKYLPWTMNEQVKSRFINTCDAMIHARYDGEMFSMATSEFVLRNRPIITWNPDNIPSHYDTGHIYSLQNKGIYYKDAQSCFDTIMNLDRKIIKDTEWDNYTHNFTAEKVMEEFKTVFIEG